jgi:hypothetical protein
MPAVNDSPPGRTGPAKRRRLTRRTAAVAAASLTLLSGAGVVAYGQVLTPNTDHLVAVGPTEEPDGFPNWYKDSKGTRIEPCLDNANPLCNILPDTMPNPDQPVSFPDNFPDEFFYAVADNTQAPTGAAGPKLVTRMALEGAFANGAPAAGDQMVFARIRFFYSNLTPGATYKITHPYGVDILQADPADGKNPGSIRFTEDKGITPGQFGDALSGRVAPFLKWDTGAPAGYLGDPATDHAVTGSPYNTNFVRVQEVTPSGDPVPNGLDANSNLFSVSGKLATNGGVGVDGAYYHRTTADDGTLRVYANSEASLSQSIEVSGAGIDPTRMEGESGHYDAIVPFTGATPPASIKVSNVGDVPVASKTVPLTDEIDAHATFDTAAHTLTIDATSSDQVAKPTLTAVGYGDIDATGVLAAPVAGTPATVKITSKAGGATTVPVALTGPGFPAIPVQAIAGQGQEVLSGAKVTLDGSASSGPIKTYSWEQTAGPAVTLAGADTATPTFDAPAVDPDATLTFKLTVANGATSSSSGLVDIHVVSAAAAKPPTANAGPDQVVAEDGLVTLDGTGSTDATTYAWTQTGGPTVTLTGANTAKPTFRFPKQNVTLTFSLKASGAAGSTTDEVKVSTTPDRLTASLVQFTTSKAEWRLTGTDSLVGPGVSIKIHNGATVAAPVIGGTPTPVDTLGAWTARFTGPVPAAGRQVTLESSAGAVQTFTVTVK